MAENIPRLMTRHYCGLWLAMLAYWSAFLPPVARPSGTVLPFRRRA
jgi:hypothetical protein